MTYKTINLENYARKDHFNYFRSIAYPYVGITVNVDVTKLVDFAKNNKYSFYLLFIHAVALSADNVPELRQRICNNGIIEYEKCNTSHVELLDSGAFCYCRLRHDMELTEYIKYATTKRQESREKGSIEEFEDVNSLYFISTLPWLHYTTMTPALAFNDESNPRITWGKYEKDYRGKLMLPVTLFAHHALVDGLHLAKFYEELNKQIEEIATMPKL